MALGGPDRGLVLLAAEADVEHAVHPCRERVGDELGLGSLAEKQVRVGIDHRLSLFQPQRSQLIPHTGKKYDRMQGAR
jgi:hypothetical protein